MKIKVVNGPKVTNTIECDRFIHRESGFIILYWQEREVALFGPGFKGYLEIEYDSYDRRELT
jgi:hypothetical protein